MVSNEPRLTAYASDADHGLVVPIASSRNYLSAVLLPMVLRGLAYKALNATLPSTYQAQRASPWTVRVVTHARILLALFVAADGLRVRRQLKFADRPPIGSAVVSVQIALLSGVGRTNSVGTAPVTHQRSSRPSKQRLTWVAMATSATLGHYAMRQSKALTQL
jgi:hypothetical protein